MTRPAPAADEAAILALNAAHEVETGPLDAAALRALLGAAFHVGLAGEGGRDAFLVALDQEAAYASPNFLWFRARYPRFVYVDRVIVAPAARGRGLARALYDALFAAARRAGHDLVGCEVNVEPPNPGSMAFHDALGFAAVGASRLPGGKAVRYLAHSLGPQP